MGGTSIHFIYVNDLFICKNMEKHQVVNSSSSVCVCVCVTSVVYFIFCSLYFDVYGFNNHIFDDIVFYFIYI